MHDGFGVWRAARRRHAGGFVWPECVHGNAGAVTLTPARIDALVQSARLSGHGPWASLPGVPPGLPTHPVRDIDALPPHRWTRPPPVG